MGQEHAHRRRGARAEPDRARKRCAAEAARGPASPPSPASPDQSCGRAPRGCARRLADARSDAGASTSAPALERKTSRDLMATLRPNPTTDRGTPGSARGEGKTRSPFQAAGSSALSCEHLRPLAHAPESLERPAKRIACGAAGWLSLSMACHTLNHEI